MSLFTGTCSTKNFTKIQPIRWGEYNTNINSETMIRYPIKHRKNRVWCPHFLALVHRRLRRDAGRFQSPC
jgi:hypothetical protein